MSDVDLPWQVLDADMDPDSMVPLAFFERLAALNYA